MVYTSLYNKTIDGVTGKKKSIIVEMDPNNYYKVQRCFQLSGELEYRHNGGLAFFKKSVYVSSAGYIETYSIPDYTEGTDKYVTIERSYLASVSSIASYMTYYNDTVWVGDFVTSGDAYIKGYPLNDDGSVNNSVTPKKYKVLPKTQGVAWTNIDGTDFLMISVSYGDSFSKIYRVLRKELTSSLAPSPDKVFTLPAGGEDLTFDNENNLISQSESGAKYFQKRSSPWDTFFPFIYKISSDKLFGDIVSVEEKKLQLPTKFKLYSNYPNPFNPSTAIQIDIPVTQHVTLKVFNIHGELVATITDNIIKAGSHRFIWNGKNKNSSKVASGIYFYQIITNGFNQIKKMLLIK
ncbi:MAG: T9SS type A sorting domain-containing protein [Ignavibacteriae bacterium]|nr:T9SS type A sorting domain-containing protein [Ignavibacteriota bacterium]